MNSFVWSLLSVFAIRPNADQMALCSLDDIDRKVYSTPVGAQYTSVCLLILTIFCCPKVGITSLIPSFVLLSAPEFFYNFPLSVVHNFAQSKTGETQQRQRDADESVSPVPSLIRHRCTVICRNPAVSSVVFAALCKLNENIKMLIGVHVYTTTPFSSYVTREKTDW